MIELLMAGVKLKQINTNYWSYNVEDSRISN